MITIEGGDMGQRGGLYIDKRAHHYTLAYRLRLGGKPMMQLDSRCRHTQQHMV